MKALRRFDLQHSLPRHQAALAAQPTISRRAAPA